jgi:multicomponent Na+:H+ antiporter subunit B
VSRRARGALALAALGGLAALLVLAVTGLPGSGHPAGPNARAVPLLLAHLRQTANAVNGVTYDLRGADTLGEELILFAAALGAAVLLRAGSRPREASARRRPRTTPSSALRAFATVLVAPLVVLGAYVVTHGHLSPGGGFQGGVALAALVLLVYAAGRQARLRRAAEPEHSAEVVEATGAVAFALVALGGLVLAGALLANFIAYGSLGSLLSGGTIPLLSLVTGVEVTGAVALIVLEFMEGEW